jgi:predicted DNA binding CopG/RHH family protein
MSMKKGKMTADEKDVLDSFERGEWRSARNKETQTAKLKHFARNTLLKNKRINIRLSEIDLLGLQAKAVEEGLPYQTLISSVLHKYLTGTLTDKRRA